MTSRRLPLISLLVLSSLLAVTQSSVAATSSREGQTLQLLAGDVPAGARVLDASGRGLTLGMSVPTLEVTSTSLDGRDFDLVTLPGAQLSGNDGEPSLPIISRLVAVPRGMTLAIGAVRPQYQTLDGTFRPAPGQGLRARDDSKAAFSEAAYLGSQPFGAAREGAVQVGEPALIRDQRVVPVTFNPLTWDPVTGQVTVSTSLEVDLEFVPAEDGNNPLKSQALVPESFANLYAETVLGYERAAGSESVLGTWLVIYPNVTGVTDAIDPLIKWRERQGYNVLAVSTSTTGTSSSAIKSYIQSQYDSLEIPLEFVTLVGDADGSVSVASWRENLSGYNGEGDHEYTRLSGGDVLADVHLGRLSATSVSELQGIVNKVVAYETAPYLAADPGWFTRAGLAGDPGSSGYSTIWVSQWVKEQLEELSYTQIDTIWDGNFVTQMMGTINQGETIFTYRGYWGMSGMNTGYIAALNNGQKLPFALILTCDTGSFWSDSVCRSEAFLRNPNGGGVASIGTATIGTHTRYNNCMFQGVAEGVLNSGDPRVGPGLTRGKLSMYENYFGAEPTKVTIWSTWNNLMGDPATALWSAVPAELAVEYPAAVSVAENALPVTVTSGGLPVAGARVAIFQKNTVQANGLTGPDGTILLPMGNQINGEILVTVTGRNLAPHLGGVNVGDVDLAVAFNDLVVVDDGTGASSGNGDGLAGPGETVEVQVQLLSSGTGGASDVTASLGTSEQKVSVLQGEASYGYLGSGSAGWGDQPFLVDVAADAVAGQEIPLVLEIASGTDSWTAIVPLTVHGPAALISGTAISGAGDGVLDPGEVGTLRAVLDNVGNMDTAGITAMLTSNSQWVTVVDGGGAYGPIPAGGSGDNTSDQFTISAASDCYPGHLASFTLDLTFAEGGTAQLEFQLQVGQAASTDPVGPDAFGYYAFDDTDTGYDLAPTFDWVEIDPGLGGSGTSVGLTDYGRYQDDTRTITLPFDFGYYGQVFDQVSICSNGWIAMGQTYVRHYRNWTIPSPGGPDNMIAVFWDDLYQQSTNGGVYYWHDVANHRFIVEWSRVLNYMNNATETFQVMLYDPAYLAGDSGDGLIVAQYQTVNQTDYENGYATAGIQNEDRDGGLLYTYWNNYPGGGATLQSGRAIAYRTVEAQVQGVLRGTVTNASAAGTPVDGATVSVLGSGRTFLTTVAGLYQGGVPVGTYDVAVSHPSFAPDTTFAVDIAEGREAVVDFALTDIAGPEFTMVTMPENTEDTGGPYAVEVAISDYSGLDRASFFYTSSASGGPFVAPLTMGAGGLYQALIPGQPDGTRIQYWLTGADGLGNTSVEPAGAPFNVHTFVVTGVTEIYTTDMETQGDWTGGVSWDTATTGLWTRVDPNGVYEADIVVQPEDDHTPSGSMCWITGNDPVGSAQGTDDVDGGMTTLETPTFNVAGMSGLQVSYFRWYTNDTGQNPGSDYWRVQASTGDGSWVSLEETNVSNRSWQPINLAVEDFLELGDQLTFRFIAEDAAYGSVIEAGVDDFTLMGYNLPGDSAAPEVNLTSFNGGQVVLPGSSQTITWNHSDDIGVVQVEILLSQDAGASWEPVATGPYNQTYDWVVPSTGYADACRLKVVCHDAAGGSTEAVSAADFTIDAATPAGDLPGNRLHLAQNSPNPFNPRTEIRFAVPSRQKVSLKIYSLEGKLVRTLIAETVDAGQHMVAWSGKDDRDGQVASGLYFYRLTTDDGVLTRKMTLLK